jgi:hypothetical protein
MRNCYVNEASRVLWLKMRPDTPQLYEFISVENIKGQAKSMIYVKPWTQFFDLQGRKDAPVSYCDHINLKNIDLKCDIFFDVAISKQSVLSNFNFDNLNIETKDGKIDKSVVNGFSLKKVNINKALVE